MAASCSPPKSQGVKAHTRSKPRKKRQSTAEYVVRDRMTGKVRSRHRTMLAAAKAERLANRALRRQGRKPHFETARA